MKLVCNPGIAVRSVLDGQRGDFNSAFGQLQPRPQGRHQPMGCTKNPVGCLCASLFYLESNMNTQSQTQTATTAAAAGNGYFDSALYARAYLNEIKLVDGKKGKKPYCAINASIVEAGADGKVYRTIDLIVRGKPAKEVLQRFRDRWPADRTKREANPWLADINVGSIRVESYRKRDGATAAVLKGRLLNIRALRIGQETVHGEMPEVLPQPLFVAPCYINEIKPDKGRMKVSALDGLVSEPEYFSVSLDYGENAIIAELLAMGICPKGYQHRTENPKVFAVLEIGSLEAAVFTPNGSEPKAYAKGKLGGIRYLKADSEVIVDGKKAAA
jgi:hypothetical protein